ncbi:MAG: hypothetical protein BGO23_13340 [Solirubrobacterales bacterium 67-14]|nr:MAG: hypothetical protein BGO23_13340 [Solirubrobacterales bacterium 67-14]
MVITIFLLGGCVLLLRDDVPRSWLLRRISFWGGLLLNEQGHWFAVLLAASVGLAISEGDVSGPGWITVGLAVLVAAGMIELLARSFPSRPALRRAMGSFEGFEAGSLAGPGRYLTTLALPFAMGRSRIKLRSNISYGPAAGRANLLDLYLPRSGEVTGPTLIYLHGGRFKMGSKRREAQAIKCSLARRGWAVISANYQLVPQGTFPDYLIDLKRVIDWARTEGRSFGLDPDRIFLSGGSAGAHISAMAALTPDRADLQPGFEQADTAVSGVIGLYGYYGSLDVRGGPISGLPSGPRDHVHPGAPPFLLIHGDHDSVMGPDGARALVDDLGDAGNQASLAILPGAQHSFDLLRSVRTENTIDAIEDFAAWAGAGGGPAEGRRVLGTGL